MTGQNSGPEYVSIVCPVCETSNFFPASQAGQTQPCEFCGNLLTVPQPPPPPKEEPGQGESESIPLAKDQWWQDEKIVGLRVVKTTCPLCETLVSAPAEKAGQEVPCPDCGRMVLMPQPVDDPGMIYGEAVPYAVAMDPQEESSEEPIEATPVVPDRRSAILERVQRRPPPEPAEPPPSTPVEEALAAWKTRMVELPPWDLVRDLLLFPWTTPAAFSGLLSYLMFQVPLLLGMIWLAVNSIIFYGLIRHLAQAAAVAPATYILGGWFPYLVEAGFNAGPKLEDGVDLDPGEWVADTLQVAWYLILGMAATVALTFWFLFFLPQWAIFAILAVSGYLWMPLLMIGSQVSENQTIPVVPAVFQSVVALPGTWLATWLVPVVYLAALTVLLEVAAWLSFWAFWALLPVVFGWWFMLWGRWIGWCSSRIAPFLMEVMGRSGPSEFVP